MTTRTLAAIVAASTLVTACGALAQATYPHRPVRIIVPFPPGGPADALARLTADTLAQSLGKPFIVDNKAGFEATSWYALVAPAGTPSAIVDRLHGQIVRALALPDVREKIAGLGADPVGNSPAEFAAMQRAEAARWIWIAKEANMHAD